MADSPIEWRGTYNAVHVRIRQRVGLVAGWVELRAIGVTLRVEGRQFTDRSRSPTPIERVRKLGMVGLEARWERERVAFEAQGLDRGARVPAILTLRRPDRPDVYLPGLDASTEELDALCAALLRAAEAAAGLVGHGRAEVPRALRSLLGAVED